jgi:hypothetical protein
MRGRALLTLLVVAMLVCTGCRSEPVPSIVGSWRHWEGTLTIEFTQDGRVIYRVDLEDLPFDESGTYQLLGEDRIVIESGFPPNGEFNYEIQGDVLVLVGASGTRQVFNRAKASKE